MEKDFIHQELEVAQAGADIKEGSRGGRIGKVVATSFFSVSILLTICAVIFTIVFFVSEVFGSSMMLTLNRDWRQDNRDISEHVLVNRFIEPRRGDIVVLQHTWGPTTSRAGQREHFIKRVIAVGGDRVRFNRYHDLGGGNLELCVNPACLPSSFVATHIYRTVVNDIEIDEYYLDDVHWGIMAFYGDNIYEYINGRQRPHQTNDFIPFRSRSVMFNGANQRYEIFVEADEVFVMGDNRGSANRADWDKNMHSYDSTAFGPIQRSTIEGVSVDIIGQGETIPGYVWRKVRQFFRFNWI